VFGAIGIAQPASGSSGTSAGELGTPSPHAASGRHEVPSEHAARILQQVRVALVPSLRQATIQLSPPSLGRVEVRIAMSTGRLRAEVRAERPETLQVLSSHVPELRAALAVQGIQADHVELNLGFGAAREDARGHARGDRKPAAAAPLAIERVRDGVVPHALARAMAAARGGVDLYA
jgi:hypothetical protein